MHVFALSWFVLVEHQVYYYYYYYYVTFKAYVQDVALHKTLVCISITYYICFLHV